APLNSFENIFKPLFAPEVPVAHSIEQEALTAQSVASEALATPTDTPEPSAVSDNHKQLDAVGSVCMLVGVEPASTPVNTPVAQAATEVDPPMDMPALR
ncbi:hypothetical protein EIP86_007559, partial [Pleurotus ostreatoroseus]